MYVTLPITKEYAREMIGQMVYVGWPYLTEAYLRLQDIVSNSSWFVKCFRMALLTGHMSEHFASMNTPFYNLARSFIFHPFPDTFKAVGTIQM